MIYRQSPEVTRHFKHNTLSQYYKQKNTHVKRNKHHYEFIALAITLAFLAALSLTLANIKL